MTSSYTVYLAWLQSRNRELQWLEYLKSVFLDITNVTSWSVFQNQVTFSVAISWGNQIHFSLCANMSDFCLDSHINFIILCV